MYAYNPGHLNNRGTSGPKMSQLATIITISDTWILHCNIRPAKLMSVVVVVVVAVSGMRITCTGNPDHGSRLTHVGAWSMALLLGQPFEYYGNSKYNILHSLEKEDCLTCI